MARHRGDDEAGLLEVQALSRGVALW